MRVVHVTTWNERCGIAAYAARIAAELERLGVEQSVVARAPLTPPVDLGRLPVRGTFDPTHPAPVKLDTMVLPVLAPQTKLQLLPLIEIDEHPEGRLAGWLHEIEGVAIAAKDYLLGHDGLLASMDRSLFGEVIHALTEGRIPIVSLKQYRDTVSPNQACYQALVSAVMRITKRHGGGLLRGRYSVKIHDYASTQIVQDLGLKVGVDGTIEPRGAYWISFDCTYGEGENLYIGKVEG